MLLVLIVVRKDAKRNKTFFVTFFSLVAFRLVESWAPAPPGYAYDCNFNAICDTKILCAFLPLSVVCVSKQT